MSALKALAALVTAGLSVLYVVLTGEFYAAIAAVWAFTAGVWLSNLIFTWGDR